MDEQNNIQLPTPWLSIRVQQIHGRYLKVSLGFGLDKESSSSSSQRSQPLSFTWPPLQELYPLLNPPLVDSFSSGMGESAGGAISLTQTAILGKILRYDPPELKFDSPRFGIRIAPFGNPAGPLESQLPHFHFRIGSKLGESYRGFGWRWHHPWDDIQRGFKYLLRLIK